MNSTSGRRYVPHKGRGVTQGAPIRAGPTEQKRGTAIDAATRPKGSLSAC
jgi:hypothetical protein